MDGYEFLDRALRSDPGVHVILMTGDYTLDRRWKRSAGASDFLPKPIDARGSRNRWTKSRHSTTREGG